MAEQLLRTPWVTMWTKPTQTIRDIVKKNPSMHLMALSAIYGFPVVVHGAQFLSLGESLPTWLILVIVVLLSPLIGFIGISFWSLLIKWTGSWIGGKANYKNVRAAVAWSNVPNLVNVLLWILLAFTIGSTLFSPASNTGEVTIGIARIVTMIFAVQVIISVWSFVIFVMALAEVQGFSALRALGNILIPCLLFVVLAWIFNSIVLGIQS